MEKEMAIHSSVLAWKIPWTEEPGRLHSTVSQREGHDLVTEQATWIDTKNKKPNDFMFLLEYELL